MGPDARRSYPPRARGCGWRVRARGANQGQNPSVLKCPARLSRPLLYLVSARSYGEDWAWCQTHHLFGNAAQKDMLEACPPMRAHDNEISVALLGDAHNRFRWVPGSNFNFPGAVKGLWYE